MVVGEGYMVGGKYIWEGNESGKWDLEEEARCRIRE